MLSITVTLVVQALNFLISWWILDTFLFRPYVSEIFKERKIKSLKEDAVSSEIQALSAAREEKRQFLKEVDREFSRALPAVVQDVSLKTVSERSFFHIQECDITTQKMVTKDLVAMLVKRITHV